MPRRVWSGLPFDLHGEHYHVEGLTGTPSPATAGGPPILVGGGGPKVLALAARKADIVGLNASLHGGVIDASVARSALAERFVQRRRWVQEAAGAERFPQLELQLNTFMVQLTDRSSQADELFEALAGGFGLRPDQARQVPLVLVGTVDGLCEQLQHHRETYATSYIVIHDGEIDAFAPVVARLHGT